jgi:hypothetical protein
VGQVDDAAVGVLEGPVGNRDGHRVHGEVAPAQVAGEGVAEVDVRLARGEVVGIRAVRRDLDLPLALAAADGPERAAHVPDRVGPALEQGLGLVGARGGREVEVVVLAAEHRVAHRAPDQGELVTGVPEAATEVVENRGDPVQLQRDRALDVGQPERGERGVGHGSSL